MRATDRPRRTGAAAAMAVVTGGTVTACSATAMQPAVSPEPAAAVTGAAAPLSALAAADPGQRVELTITRSGHTHTVPVTLGTLPAA